MPIIIQLELTMLNNIDLGHIKKTKWYRQGAAARPYYFYPAFEAFMELIGRENVIIQQEGELHHAYFNSDLEYKIAQEDISKQRINNGYVDHLIGQWSSINSRLEGFISSLDWDNLVSLNDRTLLSHYKTLSDFDRDRWRISIHIECFDPWSDVIIAEHLRNFRLKIKDNDLQILLAPEQLSYVQQEEYSLCNIFLSSKADQEELLKQHQKSFFWIQNDWSNLIILDIPFFKRRLEALSNLGKGSIKRRADELINYNSKIKDNKIELFDLYKISDELKNFLYFFSRMSIWRDERKRMVLQQNYYYHLCAKQFSARTNIPVEEITFLFPDEIVDNHLLFSEEFKKALSFRAKQCFYYVDTLGETVVLIGDNYVEFKKLLEDVFNGQFTGLKGMIAQPGKALGRVKVINVPGEFEKMKQGDILVAPMTRPEYLPLMKIAGAIVTDEGGVTCHAAIVSRELGIPCIIGTQVATEVLKDGDEVEVDANLGVIRKIS